MDIEKPTQVNEVQRFCGLVNFFGRFIPNYSSIIAPLTELTRNGRNFSWNDAYDSAFLNLKKLISSELHRSTTRRVVIEMDSAFTLLEWLSFQKLWLHACPLQ